MMRVGILQGGHQHGLQDRAVPPAQRLRIAKFSELSDSGYVSSALSDSESVPS